MWEEGSDSPPTTGCPIDKTLHHAKTSNWSLLLVAKHPLALVSTKIEVASIARDYPIGSRNDRLTHFAVDLKIK